jgi:hypothetical protein
MAAAATALSSLDWMGYLLILVILGVCAYVYFKSDDFQLTCIVSTVDGNKYCVRERSRLQESADLLATVANKCKELVEYLKEKYPDREDVRSLAQNFQPNKIVEILPTSSYTAYSENKGEKLAFCLNVTKGGTDNLIDEHTLMFVALHECSHIFTYDEVGHTPKFWNNFKFLLEEAKSAGLHEPVDYSQTPKEYCSMKISDSPYF